MIGIGENGAPQSAVMHFYNNVAELRHFRGVETPDAAAAGVKARQLLLRNT
jgi:hypothetical protein